MKRKYQIMLAGVGAVVVLVTAVATTAFAASRTVPETSTTVQTAAIGVAPVATPTDADYQAWGCPVANDNYEAIAKLLGMTTQDIQTQLEQGKTLVEIAVAKDVSEDKLVATILAPMKDFMQQQVTAGTWTQAQLDARLKLAEQHIRQLVNSKGNAGYYGGCGNYGGGMMGGWRNNGTTSTTPGGQPNASGFSGRGGMMGGYGGGTGGYGGMMGGGYGGMMGGGW